MGFHEDLFQIRNPDISAAATTAYRESLMEALTKSIAG